MLSLKRSSYKVEFLIFLALFAICGSSAHGQEAADSIDAESTGQNATATELDSQSNSQDLPINAKVGYRVDIGGAGSPAAGLQLTWKFTELPEGSHPRIFDNPSVDPYFIPDEQGKYVLEGSGSLEKRTLIYTVGPGHTITTLQTRVLDSGAYNIIVDGTKYRGPANPAGSGTNVVLLDRATLKLVDSKTFTDISLKTYLQNVLRNSNDVLAIISTNDAGPGFAVGEIAPELEQFGANYDFRGNAKFPFSFIGIKKSSFGQAFQVGNSSLNLAGYLAPDASGKYAFIQTDYRTFKIVPSLDLITPSTVTVDGATVLSSSTNGCFGGGFLLGILDRASLAVKFSANYCTLSSTPAGSIAAQQALSAKLNAEARTASPLAVRGPVEDLVVLVSFGQSHNGSAPVAPNFAKLAYAINFAGGTYEAVYDVNKGDTYSLITSPDAAVTPWEAGSQIEFGSSGAQEGVLARGRLGNWYAPVAATAAVGSTNFGLDQILAQAPRDFPVPVKGDAAEESAFVYLSQQLCGASCDSVRPAYENTNIDLGIYYTKLNNLAKDPRNSGSASCAEIPAPGTPYCKIRSQLLVELEYAINTRLFAKNVSSLWTDKNTTVTQVLLDVTSRVDSALQPNNKALVSPIVDTVISGALGIAKAIPPPAGAIFGVAHGVFLFAKDLANDNSGNNSSLVLKLQAGQLAGEAAANFAKQKTATGVMFNSIYEDWGKLQNLGLALESGDPGWIWNGDVTTGKLLDGFILATEQADYRSLLPAIYVTRYWNAQDNNKVPWEYTYIAIFRGTETPILSKATPEVDFLVSPSPRAFKTASYPDILTISTAGGLPDGFGTQYRTPPADLVQHLIAPASDGLGIWKPEIIRHWLPIVWCGPPGNYYHFGSSGCENSTIRMPLLDLGKLTSVSLSSSINPSIQGKEVVLVAKVFSEDGGEETGVVQFTENGELLGFANLCHGEARFKTSELPVGTDIIVATYLGNKSSQVSESEPFDEIVDP